MISPKVSVKIENDFKRPAFMMFKLFIILVNPLKSGVAYLYPLKMSLDFFPLILMSN